MAEKKPGRIRRVMRVIWNTVVQYGRHNSPVMAAGMSFFAMLALVPLTLLGVSLLGYILGSSEDAQQFVSKLLLENFPEAAKEMLRQINAIVTSPQRTLVNSLSALGLVWSGLRFFNMLQRVLSNIWTGATQRWFLRGRLAAFAIFIVAGFFFWAFFVLSSLMAAARELDIQLGGLSLNDIRGFWFAIKFLPTLIASIFMLFFVYHFVPHGKVSWRAALTGAIFASVFLELSRYLFSFVMMKFDVYGRLYGPLAGVIIFMSWLYVSMSILLLGAELGSQCQEIFFSADTSEAE